MLLIQSAVAVAQSNPPLSIGEWMALISCGAAMGGVVYKTGANSAETRHIKETSESHWTAIKGTLEKITEYIDESMRLRIQWADWRGGVSREVSDARTVADEAKEIAHKARTIAQALELSQSGVEARLTSLERGDDERRHDPPRRKNDQ